MSKKIILMTFALLFALVSSGCVYDPYYYGYYDDYGYSGYGYRHSHPYRYHDRYYYDYDHDYRYRYRH